MAYDQYGNYVPDPIDGEPLSAGGNTPSAGGNVLFQGARGASAVLRSPGAYGALAPISRAPAAAGLLRGGAGLLGAGAKIVAPVIYGTRAYNDFSQGNYVHGAGNVAAAALGTNPWGGLGLAAGEAIPRMFLGRTPDSVGANYEEIARVKKIGPLTDAEIKKNMGIAPMPKSLTGPDAVAAPTPRNPADAINLQALPDLPTMRNFQSYAPIAAAMPAAPDYRGQTRAALAAHQQILNSIGGGYGGLLAAAAATGMMARAHEASLQQQQRDFNNRSGQIAQLANLASLENAGIQHENQNAVALNNMKRGGVSTENAQRLQLAELQGNQALNAAKVAEAERVGRPDPNVGALFAKYLQAGSPAERQQIAEALQVYRGQQPQMAFEAIKDMNGNVLGSYNKALGMYAPTAQQVTVNADGTVNVPGVRAPVPAAAYQASIGQRAQQPTAIPQPDAVYDRYAERQPQGARALPMNMPTNNVYSAPPPAGGWKDADQRTLMGLR